MIEIVQLEPAFAACLPETFHIVESTGLRVHPAVTRITLHGSRGLAGIPRPDSDLDLSLVVSFPTPPVIDERLGQYLREVIEVTWQNWTGPVELDLAVVFPLYNCGLLCFERTAYDPARCSIGGVDCFGVYKLQRGFVGFVPKMGIHVQRMYPCITIWKRSATPRGLPQMW